jgi:hypothetical protein
MATVLALRTLSISFDYWDGRHAGNQDQRGSMKRTYLGSCHCGYAKFEVDADLDHVRSCDCSICTKRGALIHRVEEPCLRILTPLEDLTLYQWHTGTAEDYFCPRCGILPFRKPRRMTEIEISRGRVAFTGWAVNVRCLAGVDLSAIPIKKVYGSRLD